MEPVIKRRKISPEAVDEIVTVGQAMDLIKKMN